MVPERIQYLAEKYFNRSGTVAELEELAKWVNNTPDDDSVNYLLKKAWDSIKENESMPDDMSDRILSSLLKPAVPLRVPGFFHIYRWHVAATVVVMLSIGTWLWLGNMQNTPIADTNPGFEEVTPYIRNITLPDGSMLVLHKGSKLEYADNFNKNMLREVTLTGEAYFDIKPDTARPFIIHTGSVKTTVLGTALNIRAYADSAEIIVSVTRGKVQVEDKKKLLAVLTPDQQITYNKIIANAIQQNVKAEDVVTNWTKEAMDFKAVSLEAIVQLLSIRYATPISFSNEASRHCLVTVSFSGTESLQNIMDAICTILGNSFELKSNNEIIITGKSCEHT